MILLDTSYLVALFNQSDSQHVKAKEIQRKLAGQKLAVSEYVILELSTILAMRGDIQDARQAITSLLESEEVRFIPCGSFFSVTLETMLSQKKFKLSFVDCSVLVLLETGEAEKLVSFDAELKAAAKKYLFA